MSFNSWRIAKIALFTFTFSLVISFLFQFSLALWFSLVVLFFVVVIGIGFDLIGTAVTAASEPPFHAMGADRIAGSRQAIYLIRHADRVANICNDVVGDIAGTIGGAIIASIGVKLSALLVFLPEKLVGAMAIALIAALTVGGKGLGKSYAIRNANRIVFTVGKLLNLTRFPGITDPKKIKARSKQRKARKSG